MIQRIITICSIAIHLTRTFFQVLYGAWKIAGVGGPYVSIFGGARFNQKDPYALKAHELAGRFVQAQITVLTGGGPGIMQAASCGAFSSTSKAKSIGIGVRDLGEGVNPCVQMYFKLDYFFARKWLLTRYSSAFIVFPGGFGTLDELAEVIVLMQTKHMQRVPIILIGVEYWAPFMQWLKTEAIEHDLVSKEDFELFTITDDLDQAFCLARNECDIK